MRVRILKLGVGQIRAQIAQHPREDAAQEGALDVA